MKAASFSVAALFLLFLLSSQPNQVSSRCILRYPRDTCFELYNAVNRSLRTERNIFELVQFFFPKTPYFTTQFVNILYTLTYTNATTMEQCPGTFENSIFVQPEERTQFLQGWSGTGVYNIISPTDLTKMQLQILNELLSLFITPGTGIALPGNFIQTIDLENNTRAYFTDTNFRVNLELNIDTFPCIPSVTLMHQVLQDMTTMLKIIASTEGRPPERIEDDDLGYATEGSIIIPETFTLRTDKRFIHLFAISSCVLGLAVVMISSRFFVKFFEIVGHGRSKFGYYLIGLTIVTITINLAVVITEWWKLPQWCEIEDLSTLIQRPNETGCDALIITELVYQGAALIITIIAAIVIGGALASDGEMKRKALLKISYTILVWSLLFLIALIAWSFIPTLLIAFVYPSIVISVVVLILGALFWISVLLTVPFLMFHNINSKKKWRNFVYYLIPLAGLFLGLLAAVLLTITYLNAAVWGSGVGGAAGLAVAIVPGLALTLFSEFYRDWFLTRIIGMDDDKNKKKQSTTKKKKSTKRKPERKKENGATQEGLQEEPAETRPDQVTIELHVIDNPAVQNGGDKVKNGNKEEQPNTNNEVPEVEVEEEEDEEEEEENEEGVWSQLRRSTEPAHFLKREFSRIYNSSRRRRRRKDDDD